MLNSLTIRHLSPTTKLAADNVGHAITGYELRNFELKHRRLDIPNSPATVHVCGELPKRALLDVTVA